MKEFKFKRIYTDNFETRPNPKILEEFQIISGSPVSTSEYSGVSRYKWVLLRKDQYSIYRELDLHFDIKSIKQAEQLLASIPAQIARLENTKKFLEKILGVTHVD
jgi:hypothetical protein